MFLRVACVLVAIAPVTVTSFLGCERPEPAAPAPMASGSAPSATTTTATSTSASTESAASVASAVIVASASTSTMPKPPPVKEVAYYGPCAAAGAVVAFINAHRACTTDDECAVETTAGGLPGACGIGIQKTAAAELHTRSRKAFESCSKAGIPMPIPSCPMPPPPRCDSSSCQP